MASPREIAVKHEVAKKLTKQEIDRRIQSLASRLAEERSDSLHPRLMATAELVRCMQPFVVYN